MLSPARSAWCTKKLNSIGTLIQRTTTEAPQGHMYYIGLDVHKKTISYCVKDASGQVHQEGKVGATRWELDDWIKTLHQPWTVAMEATIFTGWIYDHLLPHAQQVKVAHPLMLRAIAAAKKGNATSYPSQIPRAQPLRNRGPPGEKQQDHTARSCQVLRLPTERRISNSRGSLRIVSGLAVNTHSIFCDGPQGSETVNGCPVLRRQEPSPRGTRASCGFCQSSPVRAPPKRASGESFSP